MTRPFLPPRWVITTAWRVHRALFRVTGGRAGLRPPRDGVAGMLRLHTVGKRSGEARTAILCYIQDDTNLVTLAMNGWSDPPPSWWVNLRAAPDASVETVHGPQPVHARLASGKERQRLWERIARVKGWAADLDAMAALRSSETPIVILEPRSA